MKTGAWHVANFFTFGNALSGLFAIFFAAQGNIDVALRLIALGMLLDSFDGPIARWRGPTEEGKTLDRMSDRITMAIAPATLLVVWASFHPISMMAGALVVFTSLVRLARPPATGANIVGLPLWAPTITIMAGIIVNLPFWPLIAATALISALGLSKIPLSFPEIIGKPSPGPTNKKHLWLVAARSAPFLVLTVTPNDLYPIAGLALLLGGTALIVMGTAYMAWKKYRN